MEVQETEVQEMSHVKKQKSKIHEISKNLQVFVEFPAPREGPSLRHPGEYLLRLT